MNFFHLLPLVVVVAEEVVEAVEEQQVGVHRRSLLMLVLLMMMEFSLVLMLLNEDKDPHDDISMQDKNLDLKPNYWHYFVLKYDSFVLNLSMDELNQVRLSFCIYSSLMIDNEMLKMKMTMKLKDL